MKGISHALIGSALATAACRQLGLDAGPAVVAVSVLGGLLPDIDEEHSLINKYVPLHCKKAVYAAIASVLIYHAISKGQPALLVPAGISALIFFSGHRGFTHSIAAVMAFSMPLVGSEALFTAFLASYLLHLLCDMVNTKGLQLLWPLPHRFRLPIGFSGRSIPGMLIEGIAVLLSTLLAVRMLH